MSTATDYTEIMDYILADGLVGNGTLSQVNECMTREEVRGGLTAAGINNKLGGLLWAYKLEIGVISDELLDPEYDEEFREELRQARRTIEDAYLTIAPF